MTHSNSVGFIIWGVRNGFEVIAASDPNYTMKEVVNDNMRQVCNSAAERLYTVHHTDRFSAVSIYHTDVKDVVGRRAYVAITLYVSRGKHFIGDVTGVLNRLMDFYLNKQGSAKVNMFTEDMIREQYADLGAQTLPNNSMPVGKKLGYWRYQQSSEISDFLTRMNTDGYRTVFFLSPANAEAEKQLMGYEAISSFVRPVVLTLLGYSASGYTIYHNNKQLSPSQQDYFDVEGMPGDQVRISKTGTGREKVMQLQNISQEYRLSTLFPSSGSGGGGGHHPQEPKLSWKKIALFLIVFLAIIGAAAYFTLRGDDGKKDAGGGGEADTSHTPPQKDPIKDTASGINNINEENGKDSTVNKADTIRINDALTAPQQSKLIDTISKKMPTLKIKCSVNGQMVIIERPKDVDLITTRKLIIEVIKFIQKPQTPTEKTKKTTGKGTKDIYSL